MHSALFVAKPSDTDSWDAFTKQAAQKAAPSTSVVRFSENVWLLNLRESILPLGWLVASADLHKVSYGIIPFEHAPQWLPAAFDPSTIEAHT